MKIGADTPELAEAVNDRYEKHVAREGVKAAAVLIVAGTAALVVLVGVAHLAWRLIEIVWASS